jgi:hypothetical protein
MMKMYILIKLKKMNIECNDQMEEVVRLLIKEYGYEKVLINVKKYEKKGGN